MTQPLPFQEATIEAVLRAYLLPQGARRFLVADEVGLGKTIVAQGVIRGLMEQERSRPLTVFYICNSLAIANQNMARLLEVLPDKNRREAAHCDVDRLTLIPKSRPTDAGLHLYGLTPGTSLPNRKGKPGKGRKDERALVQVLLQAACPKLKFEEDVFRFEVKYWENELARAANCVGDKDSAWFAGALRWEFLGSTTSEGDLEGSIRSHLRETGRHKLMGRLRSALAAHVLREIRPDLVILDEFQRFRDLLAPTQATEEEESEQEPKPEAAGARLLRLLRGDDYGAAERPSLLLLSATPYRLLSERGEDQENAHHRDFFEVLEFLAGHGPEAERVSRRASGLFREFREGLRLGVPNLRARDHLEELLAEYLARTERASYALESQHGDARDRPHRESASTQDLSVFRHFSQSLAHKDRGYAIPYWTSVPLPAQTLGGGYVAWEGLRARRKDVPPPSGVEWTKAEHTASQGPAWPHPGLRVLLRELSAERLALPWLAPSRPWWPMPPEWEESPESPSKLLIFSRYRAVPPAVAAALSFEVESWTRQAQGGASTDLEGQRKFTAGAQREAMLALWHPSPFLRDVADPRASSSLANARSLARERVVEALKQSEVVVDLSHAGQSHGAWRVIAAIDGPEVINEAWSALLADEKQVEGLSRLVESWRQAAQTPPRKVGRGEVEWLAEHALGAPGVVLARALARHEPEGRARAKHLAGAARVSWTRLRTYLDRPWFIARLEALTGEPDAPSALRRGVQIGNFESVLDEHLWVLRRTGSDDLVLSKALAEAFVIRAGSATFHELSHDDAFRVRCHAALPFTEIRDAEAGGTTRTKDLRAAFNSPFWPYVLVTTSVGQEGLDFHLWCRDLLHWDLPGSPVDLEQREGRIRRFCGLAVRRALAQTYGGRVSNNDSWGEIASLAESDRPSDGPGLQPWWVFEGAHVRRHFLDVPLSERRLRLESLKHRRLLYRLALGQPDQEDLLADLESRGISAGAVREWALELSPWFRAKRRSSETSELSAPPSSTV